jgi:hypothetical protein
MHCEEATATLLDQLDQPADPVSMPAELEHHLDGCDECRALQQDIAGMRAQARVWHDLEPPTWNPDPSPWQHGERASLGFTAAWQRLVQLWLPLAASTAALLLVVNVYRLDGPAPSQVPQPQIAELANSPAAQALLAASRRERQREMEALTALLKAELDRQEAQTEESLKYLISHQIQSQRELDAVRGRLLQTDVRGTEQL